MAKVASSPPSCARPSGRRASRSGRFCVAWCGRSAAIGPRSRSSFAPTAITPARRSSTGARRTASTTSSASPPPARSGDISPAWRKAPRRASRPCRAAGKVRRFKEFFDAAKTWSRVRRIVARVEAGGDGTDSRFIVTNLGHGNGRSLYQDLYCRRGQAENHIKAWKTHLAADRTSCPKATANQFRLFLHAGAYWLLWSLRALMPKRSSWRVAQFDTLRLRLIKTAARIVEMKTRIKSPSADQRPRSGDLAPRSRPPAAARHLNAGAVCPCRPRPRNLQRLSTLPIPHPAAAETNPPANSTFTRTADLTLDARCFPANRSG